MSKPPTGNSNIRKFKHFPQTLAACMQPLTQPVLKKHGLEAELIKAWPSMVGQDIAVFCQPVKIQSSKNGGATLIIDVLQSHALIAQHLQSLILEKLALYHGARTVDRIKFQQKHTMSGAVLPTEFEATLEQKNMLQQFATLKMALKDGK